MTDTLFDMEPVCPRCGGKVDAPRKVFDHQLGSTRPCPDKFHRGTGLKTPGGTAKARNTDPPTSHAAARSVTGTLRTSQQAVLTYFQDVGPATDDDLVRTYDGWRASDWPSLPRQSPSGLRTRRKELVSAGMIRDTGRTHRLDSGRSAIVWEAVQ